MPRLLAIVLLTSVAACASPVRLSVDAVFADGRSVSGFLDGSQVELSGLTADGENVTLELKPPAAWSTLKTVAEIVWIADRNIFRIRAATFTAELVTISASRRMLDANGGPLDIAWSSLVRLVIRP